MTWDQSIGADSVSWSDNSGPDQPVHATSIRKSPCNNQHSIIVLKLLIFKGSLVARTGISHTAPRL
jgi:hypothetical protein